MKRNIIICLFFISSLSLLKAQSTQAQHALPPAVNDDFNPSGYVGISVGSGVPLGKYVDSGFATAGLSVAVNAAFVVTHSNSGGYGLALKLDYGTNGLNQTALENAFNLLAFQETGDPNFNSQVTSAGKFSYQAGYLGLYATFPDGKFSADLRLLAGFMHASLPDLGMNVYYNGNLVGLTEQPSASATAISVSAGGGLRFTPVHGFSIMLYGDYLYANPDFKLTATAVTQNPNGGVSLYYIHSTAKQTYELVNISLGVAWVPDFGKK